MIPVFEHTVCNEIAMQGIGAHKNGSLAAMWLEMLVLYANLNEEGTHSVTFESKKGILLRKALLRLFFEALYDGL